MSEPTVESLQAEIATMQQQFADYVANQGRITPKAFEKIKSQAELDAGYAAVRKSFNEHMMPDAKFRALGRGESGGETEDLLKFIKDQRAVMAAQAERIETLEALVLEQNETPKKGRKG